MTFRKWPLPTAQQGPPDLTVCEVGRSFLQKGSRLQGLAKPALWCFISILEEGGSEFLAPGRLAGHLAPFGRAAGLLCHHCMGHLVCQNSSCWQSSLGQETCCLHRPRPAEAALRDAFLSPVLSRPFSGPLLSPEPLPFFSCHPLFLVFPFHHPLY